MNSLLNNISLLEKESCCGCKVCGDVCPISAIIYKKSDDGFFYPNISSDCVNCGKCVSACPELSPLPPSFTKQDYVGCLDKNKKRRNTGSSGGIFGLIAETLKNNGVWIVGAVFDEDMKVRHILSQNDLDIQRMKKSKYVQSDCSGIYSNVIRLIREGQKVLFVGTPCQCNAIINCFKTRPENLYVVDFACHGVPSQDFFDKCIRFYENKNNVRVLSYTFRHKPLKYSSPQNYLLDIERDGRKWSVEGKYYDEPFYYAFQRRISLRESCYACKWACSKRNSDLTMADFWGIEKVTKKWDRTDTPSLIICNTEKGRHIFNQIKENLEYDFFEEGWAVRKNESLCEPTKRPGQRDSFMDDLIKLDFDTFVKKNLKPTKRILRDIYYATPFSIRKLFLKFIN